MSDPLMNISSDQHYTPKPTFKSTGLYGYTHPPEFSFNAEKPVMKEEQEEMTRKLRSLELAMKNLQGLGDQDIDKWISWDGLANEFVQQFQYNMELIPDEKSLSSMKKKNTKSFREYEIRWREQAARLKPPMKERKIVELFIQAQDETYYQHLLPALGKSFIEVLKMGEMIEEGIKMGRIVSFATLKAITQEIQKGSGSIGETKNEEVAFSL
ncbi:putative cell differentiation protein RCD1 -like protein [Capsicum annuum]|nr:putative cell differentiation protein RCD1 -like protein [Capsicum annuum]